MDGSRPLTREKGEEKVSWFVRHIARDKDRIKLVSKLSSRKCLITRNE